MFSFLACPLPGVQSSRDSRGLHRLMLVSGRRAASLVRTGKCPRGSCASILAGMVHSTGTDSPKAKG